MIGNKVYDLISANDFITISNRNRVLTVPAGGNTIRIYPPLNIQKDVLNEGLTLLEKSVRELK